MRLEAAIQGDLNRIVADEMKAAEGAIKSGLRETTTHIKTRLRNQVTGAGLGRKLANTWRSELYPKGGRVSLSAAGLVYTRAPDIIRSFDQGTVIRSSRGFWLAIPTENAPKRGTGGKRISPSNFPEHRFGKLRFVYRKTGASLLVVDGVRIGKSGRVGKRLKGGGLNKKGEFKKGVTTVVMFILVPQIRMPKRLNFAAATRDADSRLVRSIIAYWRQQDGRQQT